MKKTLIFLIKAYQKIISPVLDSIFGKSNTCRFEITCSEYAVSAISKYGVIKGSVMAVKRISHCHPYAGNVLKYESI